MCTRYFRGVVLLLLSGGNKHGQTGRAAQDSM